MLQDVYKKILNELAVLHSEALVHQATDDFEELQKCLNKFSKIAEELDIKTKQINILFDLDKS